MPNLNQVAAIPVRRRGDGNLEVLLVTSRETRRWIVPKGWPWPEVSDHEAAAAEAWEEAGVRGRILADELGAYTYDKQRDRARVRWRRSGGDRTALLPSFDSFEALHLWLPQPGAI